MRTGKNFPAKHYKKTVRKKVYAPRKATRGALTTKQLTRAVNKLKKDKEAKWHYTLVSNWGVSEISPCVKNLVQVPVSTGPSDVNGRLGDKVTGKYINLHCKLFYRGGQQRETSRVTVLLIRSVDGNGSILTAPTFPDLYDVGSLGTSGLPMTSAFRNINDDALTKVKILKRYDFQMAPSDGDYLSGGAAPNQTMLSKRSTFPNVIHFKIEHRLMDANITFVAGTATPLNCHYWLMAISDDSGVSPNNGPSLSCISKFRFSDAGG